MFKTRSAAYLQLAAFGGILVSLFVLSRFFPMVDLMATAQQRMIQWGLWGGLLYPFLFALCNLLLLPGSILCVGAGFFFGLWWGLIIVFVGNAVAAAISFALSRWLAARWFRRRFAQNPILRALEPAVEEEGWKIIFLSQLHPLFPASLLNYLYGLTPIRFGPYMFWTTVGRAPRLFLCKYLGTLGQLGLNVARGHTDARVFE